MAVAIGVEMDAKMIPGPSEHARILSFDGVVFRPRFGLDGIF